MDEDYREYLEQEKNTTVYAKCSRCGELAQVNGQYVRCIDPATGRRYGADLEFNIYSIYCFNCYSFYTIYKESSGVPCWLPQIERVAKKWNLLMEARDRFNSRHLFKRVGSCRKNGERTRAREERIMDAERKYYREVIKQSLRGNFEKILYDEKMTDEEEEIIRLVIIKNYSTVKTALTLHTSESTVYRTMREFYDRVQAILLQK